MNGIPNMQIALKKRPKNETLEGHRCITPLQTIRSLKSNPLIKEIVQDCKCIEDDPFRIPIHVLNCKIIPGLPKLDRVMGKGFTKAQSYCSGIMEAFERYCCSMFKDEQLIYETYDNVKEWAVDPRTLGVFRGGYYSHEVPIDWIWAWNLTQNETVLVPALFGLHVSLRNDHWYYTSGEKKTQYTLSDSNGCAAGNCIEEAILHGICEVVERDAVIINARNNLRPSDVKLTTNNKNKYLNEILARLMRDRRVDFKIKHLTLDIGIPTFACILFDKHIGFPTVGYGAHFDPEIALLRAITEQFQARALIQMAQGLANRSSMKKRFPLSSFQYLWEKGNESIAFTDIRDLSTNDLFSDIKLVVEILKKQDMDVIIVNRTKDQFQVPVIKAIIPFAQRVDFASVLKTKSLATSSDRIFRVPLKLRLRKKMRDITELDLSQITYQ